MRPAAAPRGFTLLEILVVVVIIAVVTTVAVLSVGVLGRDHGLDREGDRFTDVVAAATEQAQLEGRDYGVWFGNGRYQVLAYVMRHQRWESLVDDRLYESHELPAGVAVRLELEGKPVQLAAEQPLDKRVPQLLLFASGDASPYRLEFGREGSDLVWRVDGQADGTLRVTPPGNAP